VTSAGETSDGAGRLADTLGEDNLVVLGGDSNTTLGSLDINGLFVIQIICYIVRTTVLDQMRIARIWCLLQL